MMHETDNRWRILLVEDEETVARKTIESLERRPVSSDGENAHVERVADFNEALTQIDNRRYDVIILDIRDQTDADREIAHATEGVAGDEALAADMGLTLSDEIRKRRFLPIVFYSAVAHLAQERSNPPFITVVDKLSEEDNELRKRITDVFDSGLPLLNRSLAQHVDKVLRDYMIDFVEKNWTDLGDSEHQGDLAYLLVRRLARTLDSTFIPDMMGEEVALKGTVAHPTRLYVMPPLVERRTGDLVRDDEGRWLILLTPTCDLVVRNGQSKAKHVILAACHPLGEMEEYRAWNEGGRSASGYKKLEQLIHNNYQGQRDRYYFLPSAWGTPDLVVDLQRLSNVEFDKYATYDHIATLDDPYAQSIIAQLGRYTGRVGTPDIDVTGVEKRIAQTQRAAPTPSESSTAVDRDIQ